MILFLNYISSNKLTCFPCIKKTLISIYLVIKNFFCVFILSNNLFNMKKKQIQNMTTNSISRAKRFIQVYEKNLTKKFDQILYDPQMMYCQEKSFDNILNTTQDVENYLVSESLSNSKKYCFLKCLQYSILNDLVYYIRMERKLFINVGLLSNFLIALSIEIENDTSSVTCDHMRVCALSSNIFPKFCVIAVSVLTMDNMLVKKYKLNAHPGDVVFSKHVEEFGEITAAMVKSHVLKKFY